MSDARMTKFYKGAIKCLCKASHSRESGNPPHTDQHHVTCWGSLSLKKVTCFPSVFAICFCTLFPYGGFASWGEEPALCQSVMSRTGRAVTLPLKRGQPPERLALTDKSKKDHILPLAEGELRNGDGFPPSPPPGKTHHVVSRQEKGSSTSTLKVLSRVQVPPAQETEAGLRVRGFREAYIAGMDEMHRMQTIADALKGSKANPNVTHIEDFAAQVEDHITFFKKSGVKNEAIEVLSREARQRVQEKQVTYIWWMRWNLKMVKAVGEQQIKFNHPLPEDYTDIFSGMTKRELFEPDEVVLLPTTKELGVMAFNQVSSKKLAPVGLVNQVTKADDLSFTPTEFFLHDIIHAEDTLSRKLMDSPKYKKFHRSFRKKVKKLPPEKREKVETILFLITHEYPNFVESINDFNKLGRFFDRLDRQFFTDLENYLPSSLKEDNFSRSVDYNNAVYNYHESAIKEFEKIARKIK